MLTREQIEHARDTVESGLRHLQEHQTDVEDLEMIAEMGRFIGVFDYCLGRDSSEGNAVAHLVTSLESTIKLKDLLDSFGHFPG